MDNDKELSAFEVAALIIREFNQDINAADLQRLENWKLNSESNQQLYNELSNEVLREQSLKQIGRYDTEAAFSRLNERLNTPVVPITRRRQLFIRITAAASLLIAVSIGLLVHFHTTVSPQTTSMAKNDVAPGRNKAVLTLSDGSKIDVDDANNGTIAQQAGMQIRKTNKGQLVYVMKPSGSNGTETQYNTINTPNGGQYQVILPDGTKVWLNAASSLHYPTRFEGKERVVTLTGEGYFEVAHNAKMPFIVSTVNQDVKVLGTHFNIKSYPDEAIVTTLLEGSVDVKNTQNKNAKNYILKPGQQAVHTNGQIKIQPADIAVSMAWKNGQFVFHNTDLVSIMRQAERWYDVKVDLSNLPDEKFNGAMSRDVRLSQLLQMLEPTSNLKFRISERRIMVVK